MKTHFSDLFPAPAFLAMRPMGISFDERHVRAIELVERHGSFVLGRHGTREIPDGAIREGYVYNKEVVTEALRSLQRELRMEYVNAALPEEKAYLFTAELPQIVGSNVREAIELRLEENVPIPASDVQFDYQIIPDSGRNSIAVSVCALPTKAVETYLAIIHDAELTPASLSIEAAALAHSLVPRRDAGTHLIAHIGETRTGLSIVGHGIVQFNLTVPVGSDALTDTLTKHFSVTREKAAALKESRGLGETGGGREVFFALTNVLAVLKDEMGKLMAYWHSHHTPGTAGDTVKRIILSGRDAELSGLDDYLRETLGVPVEVGNVWQNAFSFEDYIPAIERRESLDYGSAIGAALP